MTKQDITQRIRQALPDAVIHIDDLKGDGDHYKVDVVSQAFRGLSRLQQHRLVYGALGDAMGTELHAMMLSTHVESTSPDKDSPSPSSTS